MKHFIISILILCLSYFHATSQSTGYSGGFGHFFTGPAWLEPTKLIDHFKSPEVLGPTFQWHEIGIHTGGEGFAEFNRLLIGGGGFGTVLPVMESDIGRVRFGQGGGYVKVGYVLHQTDYYFLSLGTGFGGGATYTGVKNTSENRDVFFDDDQPIRPGQEEDYFMGYLLYDFSIANKFLASGSKKNKQKIGGFMLGLDLGATLTIPVDDWRTDYNETVDAPSPGTIFSPYLRLTIGGGGFRKHAPVQTPE